MAGANKIDKHCEDCGVLLVNVVSRRKYCYDCAKIRQRENTRRSKKARQGKETPNIKTPQSPLVNPNKKHCTGCAYWGGAYEHNACCNYIFVEGHSRPCPPGKGCTERVTGNKLRSDLAELGW